MKGWKAVDVDRAGLVGLVWDLGGLSGPIASEKIGRRLGNYLYFSSRLWLWVTGVGKVIFYFLFRLRPYLRGYNIRGHTHDDN